jgi:hypothetical protein
MIRRLFASIILCAALWCSSSTLPHALEANDAEPDAIWTAVIPDAFPGYIYIWRLRADGTYLEDGRDASTGRPIQRTLSGRWSREGARMILRQDDQPFVFDGAVLGNLYAGTLYFGARAVSRFCAARGEQAPPRCDSASGVAIALAAPRTRSSSVNPAVSNGNGEWAF